MNIVLLIDSLGFGGAQRQIVNLAIELKKEGHNVNLIRYRKDDFYLSLLNEQNVALITIKESNLLLRAMRIRKKIRTIAPDVVISFMDAPNLYACLASVGKHRWKLIVSERVANESTFLSNKGKILKRIQAHFADAIVCNSKCAQDLWEKHYPKAKSNLKTIYNIIDVPDIESHESDGGKCRILVAARYEPVKNILGMIEAVATLTKEEKAQLEIHWYGKSNISNNGLSEYTKGYEAVEEKGLSQCVFLHPETDRIYPLMAEADFIALFSLAEGLPNAIIEGMTLKKPIVMSKVSDYYVLVDEANGYLCDPKDVNDIAVALRNVVNTSQDDRKKMGLVSYEKICRLCSREAVINQWNEIIR